MKSFAYPLWLLAIFLALPTLVLRATEADQPVVARNWSAKWIAHPADPESGYAVYRFRKSFSLSEKPAHFVVRVSADRRYRLYVNGQTVAVGPQRGDVFHWFYETVDLAPHLRVGSNVLAATVWNYGEDHPLALNSHRTAFILQGGGEHEQDVNSGPEWRVRRETAYSALPVDREALHTFIVVGPGDRVDGAQLQWDWADVAYDDSSWLKARPLTRGTPEGTGADLDWWLAPRNIPLPFEKDERFAAIRQQSGAAVTEGWIHGGAPWIIPAHAKARVLLDQGYETNAFPLLRLDGGKGAVCRLTYAEALVDAKGAKGNRNEVDGRRILGVQDEFIADGGADRVFSTLTFRTYRYVELKIETADEPLTVQDFLSRATGYPFEERGSFSSSEPRLSDVWQVGVRTARLCAYETYMDCPYYEQMQYVGDARIQALISLYAFGDDRLMRNAIEQIDRSRLSFGLTQSRVPTTSPQIIPPFSLFWIAMTHDYWMHRVDDAFVKARLLGIRNVIAWFEERVDEKTGLLGPLPYWNFVDWADEWPWIDEVKLGGQPPGAREGGSAILSLQFACALRDAAELASAYGQNDDAARWRSLADRIATAVRKTCWDAERKVFSDTPQKTTRSQHVNALAALAGVIEGNDAADLMRRVRDDQGLTPCTLYFRFYLLRAAKQAGLGDDYVRSLGPWLQMPDRGLTTFAERPDPTRSDCHAWSASPVYELLATVCGIEPASPGFRRVKIEPHLGDLRFATGRVPHPAGNIDVKLERDGEHVSVHVVLPPKLEGTFIWRGRSIALHEGEQTLKF